MSEVNFRSGRSLEFARRELDDDKLAETLARWTR